MAHLMKILSDNIITIMALAITSIACLSAGAALAILLYSAWERLQ